MTDTFNLEIMMRRMLLAFVMFSVATAIAGQGQATISNAAQGMEIRFLPAAVRVSGITPGGQIAFLSVSRGEFQKYYGAVARRVEMLADADGDGVIEINSAPAVPAKSIWVIVDVTSGDAIAGTPDGYPQRIGAGGEPYRMPSGHGLTKIRNARTSAEMLLVRRRSGAWNARIYKGSLRDENRADPGPSQIDVSSMTPLGASPHAPDRLIGSDVLVMIDPLEMEYWVEKVGSAQ